MPYPQQPLAAVSDGIRLPCDTNTDLTNAPLAIPLSRCFTIQYLLKSHYISLRKRMHRKIKKSFRFTKLYKACFFHLCSQASCSVTSACISGRQLLIRQRLPYIPYFSRSTLPLRTSTPSSRSRSACAPGPPNANSPDSSPFAFTTRKQGIFSGSGFL